MNIGQLLTIAAAKYPERTALIYEDKRFAYEEFNRRVNRCARALLDRGLRKGDKVAGLFFNSNLLLEVYLAVAKSGGVFTPVNFRLAAEEVHYILDNSDTRFFFFGEEFAPLVAQIRPLLPRVEFFVSTSKVHPGVLEYEALLAGAKDTEPDTVLFDHDECQLMYTSGTTGKPKGALITHGNIMWNLLNLLLGREDKEAQVSMIIGPLYHTAALNNHFTVRIALAGTTILIRNFDAGRVLETIEKEKVNVISAAPAAYHLLLNFPGVEGFDTRSVTKCTAGAATLPDETKKQMLRLFPNAEGIYDVYGCTEASPNIAILKGRDSLRKSECVGPAVAFLEVRIVDEQDREVPAGNVGELTCRGPNVMKGYYKDPQGTADALRGGWLHTGDLARRDEEGFIYIVDRKKDMIISGGENIYPREIEEVLYRHPKIQDAAVVGFPDPLWGESVRAFIVLKEKEIMREEEVIEYCRLHLASYKKPKSVRFVLSLPRNPSGKVLKTSLRGTKS